MLYILLPFAWIGQQWKLLNCWAWGHKWVHISKARVGLCHRCQRFYYVGKHEVAERRIDPATANRRDRRNATKGMKRYA